MNAAVALMDEAAEDLRSTWRHHHRPAPLLSVSQWSDDFRMLAGKAASEPGPWRTSRTPYLRQIMDTLSPRHPAELVVVQKGSQVGLTEAGNNWIGYVMDRAPGPFLAVCPTEMLAHRWSKQRIRPLIEETPCLREKVRPARKRDSGNTILMKEFPGGLLVMAGANSAVSLRSIAARYLFLDEIDAYPTVVGSEGDPLELAQRATRTFQHRRKMLFVSTPLIAGTSRVVDAFEDCEQVWDHEVPCPACDTFQVLDWAQMRWAMPEAFSLKENKKGRLRAIPGVTYECRSCQTQIPEHAKPKMLARGRWAARWDHGDKSVGFFLSALYSPLGWFGWGEAAAMKERADRRPEKAQVFVNTVLGLPYVEQTDAPEWERLFARREAYPKGEVPLGGLFLTMGVDVQADRLEVELVAWGREKRSWSIEYRVIPGDTATKEPWRELTEMLSTDYPCAWGGSMPVSCLAVDAGYVPQASFRWARTHLAPTFGGNAIAVRVPRTVMVVVGRDIWHKGLSTPKKASAEERKRGLKVVTVGVSGYKSELYAWLRQAPPVEGEAEPYGYCHFPKHDEEFFKGMCAEHIETYYVRAVPHRRWVQHYDRNEPLDCRNYARAAAAACGMDQLGERQWRRLERRAGVPIGKPAARAAAPRPQASEPVEREVSAPTSPTAPPPRRKRRRPRVRIWQNPAMRP